MNFRHRWNCINLSRPMNNKGIKCWFGVWEQRIGRPLWEIHLYEIQKRSETKQHAADSAIHHAMLFDLKRLFFINNFVIVGGVPTGERYVAVFYSPAQRGRRLGGVQCLAHGYFHRTDVWFLMGLTLHMKDALPSPLFFFLTHSQWFDLKRVFLINIYHACFFTR